jgi:hypothetical protein
MSAFTAPAINRPLLFPPILKGQLRVLDKLQVQKKGLMQDLLTGRVRIS